MDAVFAEAHVCIDGNAVYIQGHICDTVADSLKNSSNRMGTLMPPGWLATAGLPPGERLAPPPPSLELRLPLFCTCYTAGRVLMLSSAWTKSRASSGTGAVMHFYHDIYTSGYSSWTENWSSVELRRYGSTCQTAASRSCDLHWVRDTVLNAMEEQNSSNITSDSACKQTAVRQSLQTCRRPKKRRLQLA